MAERVGTGAKQLCEAAAVRSLPPVKRKRIHILEKQVVDVCLVNYPVLKPKS